MTLRAPRPSAQRFDPRRRVAVVTGASSGIGAEIARALARRDWDLALVARRGELLSALAREIAATGRPEPLVVVLDVTRADAADALLAALPDDRFEIGALINNAGFGLRGRADELTAQVQLDLLDINIRALTALTLAFLPRLKAARGKILNVASVVAFMPGPGMAVYYASKGYVLNFSEALSQELKRDAVTVTTLCPGPVDTAFWERAGGAIDRLRRLAPVTAREAAEAGVRAMIAGRRRATPGFLVKVVTLAAPLVPRRVLLPLVERLQPPRRTP